MKLVLSKRQTFWAWFILGIVNVFGLILAIFFESWVSIILHSIIIINSVLAVIGYWKYK